MRSPLRSPLAALALVSVGGLAAGARGREPRLELVDRHGHLLAHDPPLRRDAGCAPALWSAARGAPGAQTATIGSAPLATTLDGGLQVLALLAVQRGVERLSRAAAEVAPGGGAPPLAVGARRVGTIVAVREDHLVLRLRAGEPLATLPLPPPILCAGHPLKAPEPPPAERFRLGERLLVRVQALPGGSPAAEGALTVALQPQAALLALAPVSREVLALSGGYDQRPGDFDRALQGRRQAGSTWKPLVYAEALASGRRTLADRLQDLPTLYGDWRPRNFQEGYRGPVRLRVALAQSINTVAVRLLAEVGPARVAALAERLGIPGAQVPRDLTQALGTALVSPLQLAAAYAALADTREGRYLHPRLLAAAPPDGGAAAATGAAGRPALSPQVAYLISSALGSVIEEGSAARARALGLPHLHGKTGTTSNGQDAWFVGYHGALLAVVWVGEDAAPRGLERAEGQRTGAEAALPIWMEFMQAAVGQGYPPAALPRPPGLAELRLPEGGSELVIE